MSDWAAIFDWDGVIVDSSRQHERAWMRLAQEKGLPLPDGFFRRSFGMKNDRVIRELLGWTQDAAEIQKLSWQKEEYFRALLRVEGIELLPGVRDWLNTLQGAGVPCAIGSSTPRENLDLCLQRLGAGHFFRVVVAAEDVGKGKPDPEVFLTAAHRLGMAASQCVVFEDAHVGIEAARAAGMKVVGLATTHPAASLQDADLVLPSLKGLTLAEIQALLRRPRMP
ncbi:HAD family phosphatase [Fontisphaera persica]|uniref:HAD family hydrolase n=1 Tax=Fontisphaera persica TaxID=2974023 RepID=UPI0024BF8A66|nr:HAD family phosphatase [Fontisphaera persica]WCJ60872.1 HAD family phosphatase [Fontisphaera persica]